MEEWNKWIKYLSCTTSIFLQNEISATWVHIHACKRGNKELQWNQKVSILPRRGKIFCGTREFLKLHLSTLVSVFAENLLIEQLTQYRLRVESKDIFPSFSVYKTPKKTHTCSDPTDAAITLNRNNCLHCTMQHLLTDNLWSNLENYAMLFPTDI